MYRENLSRMLLPACYGKLGQVDIKKLYAAIAARGEELVLVGFGPCSVEEAVLGFEELFADDALRCQVEDEEAAIAYEAKVGAG